MTNRPDGRSNDELRTVSIDLDFTDVPDASVLVRFGRTTVWCAASVDEDVPRWMRDQEDERGWVTAEYAMLPASTSPRSRREGRRRSVGGRTHEIQRLIGRSMRAVTDLEKIPGLTFRVDCDVLQADGGTRTAAITGGFAALALACGRMLDARKLEEMPFRDTVAAISVGVVDGEVRLDLPYEEDFAAAVDTNVVMTGGGEFVEIQGTGEESTFDDRELSEMLRLARKGIEELTMLQMASLPDETKYHELFQSE